jgi:hypothetical protein
VLLAWTTIVGLDHDSSLASMQWVSKCLLRQGELEHAEDFARKALMDADHC